MLQAVGKLIQTNTGHTLKTSKLYEKTNGLGPELLVLCSQSYIVTS